MQSRRKFDSNGWFEIKDNPISKSGVFEYSGAQISPDLEPNKIYKVYRPESALNNPETIDSFKLLPWTEGHTMLGDGQTPAEEVGVQGTTGEGVYFKDGVLYSNIKIFGEKMRGLIERGIKELSCGFRCKYTIEKGVAPNGTAYDVIQDTIRGNHLALVPEGRVGSDVCVMDSFSFAFDEKEYSKMEEEKKEEKKTGEDMENKELTMTEIAETLKQLEPLLGMVDKLKEMINGGGSEEKPKEEVAEPVEDECVEDTEEEKKDGEAMDAKLVAMKAETEKLNAKIKKMESEAMDAANAVRKNELATKLEGFVGAFDHSEMDESAVAKYGIEKIGIACDSGEEVIALKTYMKNFKPETFVAQVDASAMDEASGIVDNIIGGNK